MGCVGEIDGRRVIAPLLSAEAWKEVVALSKDRKVLMPDTRCPAQAKTLRWSGGITRYFSHFPGEAPPGYASMESPEHMAMKLAIYQRLLQLGVPVELEAGQDNWRADFLVGVSAFSTALAIEVQLTQQSARRTYDRTAQRRRAGVPTLWLFGAGRLTGHLSLDLLESTPVFVVRNAAEAARIASAVCGGRAFFDDLSIFKKTPAKPLALRIDCACGQRWLYPFGAILLPNRVSARWCSIRHRRRISSVRLIATWKASSKHPKRRLRQRSVRSYAYRAAPLSLLWLSVRGGEFSKLSSGEHAPFDSCKTCVELGNR